MTYQEVITLALEALKKAQACGEHCPLYAEAIKALEVEQNTMYLDRLDMESLCQAASESCWIPKEYYRNEWIADTIYFLRTGRGIYDEMVD